MILPAEVEAITSQYLALTDDLLPGRILGFYLTGSIPLGDFHPGRSDIDGVVVVDGPVDEADVRPIHEKLPERPYFDVTYLTADALAVRRIAVRRWSTRSTGSSRIRRRPAP